MALKREDDEQVHPYNFPARFERAVVYLACADARFYGVAGHMLEAAALPEDAVVHRLALDAAHAINRDLGHGPGASLLVVQRLARWRGDGRVTHEQVLAVDEFLEQGDDARGALDVEGILNELVPVLRQRMRDSATRNMIGAVAKNDDGAIAKVEEQFARARSLGRVEHNVGTRVGVASFEEIQRARYLDRLPFNIPELDVLTDGGPPRGTLTVVLGDQKSGKSMFCSHLASSGMLRKQMVLYATLEVPRFAVLARIKGNLTGVPVTTLLNGNTAQAESILEELSPRLGPCFVKSFPARATSVGDLRLWVKDVEQTEGRPVDVLVVDYLDKLRAAKTSARDGLYQGMGEVYEETRVWAETSGFWAVSPTQSQGRDGGRGKHKGGGPPSGTRDVLDMGDEADSVEKSRVADLFLTINPRDEGRSLVFYVAGYRHGASRQATSPIPVDFACGRISPIATQTTPDLDW